MGEKVDLQKLDADLTQLERDLQSPKTQARKEQESLYRKLFGEGFWKNVDDFYNISPKADWAWEKLTGLVPSLGEKKTYMPKTAPADREWLERFLKEGES